MVKIQVSRVGLTRCPQCTTHIKVSTPIVETTCPFCGASIMARTGKRTVTEAARALLVGRGGAITASLLGLPLALASCGDDVVSSGLQDVPETVQAADDGNPPAGDEGLIEVEDLGSPPPQDVYGLPPDMGADDGPEPGDEGVEVEDSGDTPPVDLYGVPPGNGSDASEMDVEDAAEPQPQPLYGEPSDPEDAG